MADATARCPTCFTASPIPPAGGEVVCPSCEHAFTPSGGTPARKNPDVPLARALPVAGRATAPKSGPTPSTRRTPDAGDDRPRTRARRKYDDDDRPAKRGGAALPLVLVAGGVLVLLTVGGVVAVAAVMFAKPGTPTGVAMNPPVPTVVDAWATQKQDDAILVEDPRNFGRRVDEPRVPNPRFPEPPKVESKGDANPNGLVKKYQDKLTVAASSQWQSWPPAKLIDGVETTSWYSNAPDNTVTKQYPHVTLTFPEDVRVRRLTVLGNRDPEYLNGYTVTRGTMELLDANGKVLSTHALTCGGPLSDFDLRLTKPTTIRAVKFTMTDSLNGQCGLGEFQAD